MWGLPKSFDLLKNQYLLYNIKRNNQYKVKIFRASPNFDTETSIKITDTIQMVSIIHDGMEVTESQTGNAILNTYGVKQAGEISITFLETPNLDVIKFLTQKEDGSLIIPTDGTSLLPYDFYFHIQVVHDSTDMGDTLLEGVIDLLSGNESTNSISADFLLSGNLTQEYVAGEPTLQTIQATFKKLKTWGG